MKISVELTFSPLQDDFEQEVIEFIKRLRKSGLKIIENPLTTQVFGDYDKVMNLLQDEIKTAFEGIDRGLFHIKIVKSDLSNHEPSY